MCRLRYGDHDQLHHGHQVNPVPGPRSGQKIFYNILLISFPLTFTERATFKALHISTLKIEVTCSSKTMVHAYHTAWCHDREYHSMNVCETVLESTSSLSDYLVSHIPSVWSGPKTSTLRCQMMGQVLHHRHPNISNCTSLSLPHRAGKML
jgi:hypothetical protein